MAFFFVSAGIIMNLTLDSTSFIIAMVVIGVLLIYGLYIFYDIIIAKQVYSHDPNKVKLRIRIYYPNLLYCE